ncbi:MAG: restriction endonuclease subunit S [Bacteroidales bacterium]|nr:restriction endonuclease subunit S [Bacteroidales bacterium]
MTGKQLKNSILQWAIQGKLVPQDPNDEPASVLLEQIRAEKARLVKEKKIKKDKNESIIYRGDDNSYYEKMLTTGEVKCIDEEIPFDIPTGWEWERFGNIVFNRDSERIPISVAERQHLPKKYDYYGASGVIDKVDKFIFDKDLLLIGEDGANLINRNSPIAFIARGKYWVNNHAHVIDCLNSDNMAYICLYINAISLVDYVTGTAQPKMNQEKMNSILVAIPPIKEQIRIVKKYFQIYPSVENYSSFQTKLEKVNAEIYQNLKKSILQEAIQGKLVPQIASEGNASVLLQQIEQEKQRLFKEGKLKKKDLLSSTIFRGDDNKYYEKKGNEVECIDEIIPYNTPESWRWIRLGTLFQHNTGKALNASNKSGELKPYITTSNLYWNRFQLENLREMYFSQGEIDRYSVKKGDLLVCEGGDVGRAAIWNYDYEICIQNHIHKLRPYVHINIEFYYHVFYYLKNIGYIGGKGIGIQGLSSGALDKLLLPIPPLREQNRIVKELSELIKKLE